jgi:hypothetical protein
MCGWQKQDCWPIDSDLSTPLPWCEHLQHETQENTDKDDVWNGFPLRAQGKRDRDKETDKVAAFRSSAKHHIPGSREKENTEIILARHHFPRELLSFNDLRKIRTMTPFLTEVQAEIVAEKDGSKRLKEGCNKV